MRGAFSFIELIFVLVILGILIRIALPKLMVTRDDAIVVKNMENIKNATKIVESYYLTKGEEVNFSLLLNNNLIKRLNEEGWIEIKNDNLAYVYSNIDLKKVCFKYITNGKQIQVEVNKSNKDILCSGFKRFITDHNISILNNVVQY